jgi:hypothetical protein
MLLKIHIYSIMSNKKNVMHWGTFKYFYNKLQKNSFACKSVFGKNDL